ncbi:MAG: hypothetical protein ABSG22_10800 [Sedimentisphaerales bacterium]|jgi:hypothetical protein
MAEIKHRQHGGSPEIEYAEIHIPNDTSLGDGTFTTVLKPRVLSKNKPIISIMVNVPIFQISVNINPGTGEIPVLLGRADGTEPISKKLFLIPSVIDSSKSNILVARFKNWEITSLSLDELDLTQK